MTDFNELDCVRVKNAIKGKAYYTGKPVFVKAGQRGTVIRGKPGDAECDIEFTFWKSEKDFYSAVLEVPADNLELVESFADYLERKKSMVPPAEAAPGMPAETENIAVRKDE